MNFLLYNNIFYHIFNKYFISKEVIPEASWLNTILNTNLYISIKEMYVMYNLFYLLLMNISVLL